MKHLIQSGPNYQKRYRAQCGYVTTDRSQMTENLHHTECEECITYRFDISSGPASGLPMTTVFKHNDFPPRVKFTGREVCYRYDQNAKQRRKWRKWIEFLNNHDEKEHNEIQDMYCEPRR